MKILLCFVFVCLANNILFSQLDLGQIMKGPGFVGALPEIPEWSIDGQQIYYTKKFPDSVQTTYYCYALETGQTKVLTPEAWEARWVWNHGAGPLNYLRIQQQQLQCYDVKTNKVKSFPLFTNEFWNLQLLQQRNQIVFQQKHSLYKFDLTTGLAQPLVTYQKEVRQKDSQDGFSATEIELFESVRKKQLQSTKLDEHYIFSLPFEPAGAFQVDPSAHFVVLKHEIEQEGRLTEVPHFIASDAHVFNEKARSKVQNTEPTAHYYLHDIQDNSLEKLNFEHLTQMGSADRALFLHPLIFAQTKPLALCDIRSSDNKDRWIVCINLETQQIQELEHQHDSAWIGGPGISSWNMETGTLGWLKDAQSIYFQSEESGYSHLYTLDLQAKTKMALTSGNFEVHQVQLANDSSSFYLSTNLFHPGTRSFHHLDLKTLQFKAVLSDQGAYEVQLSPNEKQMVYRFSTATQPWELFIAGIKNPSKALQFTKSTTPQFDAATLNFQKPQVLSFQASDGVSVYARLYEPKAAIKNGAAVLFVHGAGYLQNAHHYWSHYHREYMFHQLLIEKGYTVLDVDYRASEGYGRNYRTAIYRHMGGRDLDDYIDAKSFLVKNYGIDSSKVGIYGGSYGGFITLMALFTKPNEFACGAALRSVTDWAHYNHEYTTNILNTPAADPEAYRQSSPIHFAEGLADPLLILHGMIDDNVQFQDVVRLNQRLIELGKKDWWMALYPVERHGFQYTSSWTDEYRRILELFDTYLLKN